MVRHENTVRWATRRGFGALPLVSAAMLLLAAIACVPVRHPAAITSSPTFDPLTFFAGSTLGTGVLQVALHRREPVRVEGFGRIDADGAIILSQTVRRGNRAATHRTWRLWRAALNRFEGTLTDAAGPVTGETQGRQLHLRFRTTGGLDAQQWLALAPDGRSASNILVFRKFGVPLARLDETIVRQP